MTAICFPSYNGLTNSLVMKDRMEVCPLARGMILVMNFNPYPPHYRAAFAFSIFLYPHRFQLALRLAFLIVSGEIRAYHVPRKFQDGLGFAYPPVVQHLRWV
jgi:hypothetical protein